MAKKTNGKNLDEVSAGATSGNGANGIRTGNDRGEAGDEAILSSDEISARAYEIYEREGRSEGRDMDHWFQAESELRAERQNRGSQNTNITQAQADRPRSVRLHGQAG